MNVSLRLILGTLTIYLGGPMWFAELGRFAHQNLKTYAESNYPDLLRLYRLTRYELSTFLMDCSARLSLSQFRRLRHLQGERSLRVQLASGDKVEPGWVNIDASANADVQRDLRKSLPLASGSASMIFCEHFLDHIYYPSTATRFLRECYRVLETGGTLRLVLHDAELLARAYLDKDAEFFRIIQHPDPPFIEGLNAMFRFDGFHQFIHDFESVERLLRSAGFFKVERSSFRGSRIPALNLDYVGMDRRVQSMYVEARKG